MGITDDMKRIVEDIMDSRHARAEGLNVLATNTRKTLEGFAADRKNMSKEQAGNLAAFVKSLAKDVAAQMKSYHADREKMSEGLRESLSKVEKSLKDFHNAHTGMSDALKKSLTEYVRDVISGPVRKLLAEYTSEMETARAAWQIIAASSAESGNGGEKVPEPAGAVEKKNSRKTGRKKGK